MVHLECSDTFALPTSGGSSNSGGIGAGGGTGAGAGGGIGGGVSSSSLALPEGISSADSVSAVDAGIDLIESLLKVMPGMSAGESVSQ